MIHLLLNNCKMVFFCIVLLPVPAFATAENTNWELMLHSQIVQHPDVTTARKSMKAVFARTAGMERPLYNPEFESEYERNGNDDNYRVGLNQTVDLWGKLGERRQQGKYLRQAARLNYQSIVQQKTADALQALIEFQAFRELAGFAEEQESQMDKLLGLVVRHQEAGDMSQPDFELAFLTLTQRLYATAQAKVQFRESEFRLSELLPQWPAAQMEIPQHFWKIEARELSAQELDRLPAVAAARAEYQAADHEAKLAKLATIADPTFGINGGRDGMDNVVAVRLSIPLNFRNTYQDEAEAVDLQAASAKSGYLAVKRQYLFTTRTALARLQEYRSAYRRWQILSQGRSATIGLLLEQQWESGDMSTADYLLTLGQRIEAMIAGIALRTRFRQSCIDWLLVSRQLTDGESPDK